MRSRVVLPQPEVPTNTMNSPSSMRRSTLSTATTPPEKCFETCSSRMSAIGTKQYHISASETTGIDHWLIWYYTGPVAAESLDQLVTEGRGEKAAEYELKATLELVRLMNAEDATVAGVVARAASDLAELIDAVVERLAGGGRLIYVGAGTSGRLAALDAAECEPTFSTEPGQVVALVAGANLASSQEQDAAEDEAEAGAQAVRELGVSSADATGALSASGRTPYVLGELRAAREAGAVTGAIVST